MALRRAKLERQQEKKKKLRKLAAKRNAETRKYRAENSDWLRALEEPATEDDEIEPACPQEKINAFLIFSNEAVLLAKYDGPRNNKVLEAAKATAAAWNRLVASLTDAEAA